MEKIGFSKRQIQYPCTSTTPIKQSGHPPILTLAQIADLFGYICMSACNRRLSFQQLPEELDLAVGKKTIWEALVKEGFHRRLVMRKPLISERNRIIRLQWAQEHANWTQAQWSTILWTEETWITGGRYTRTWVTRRAGEGWCYNPLFSG